MMVRPWLSQAWQGESGWLGTVFARHLRGSRQQQVDGCRFGHALKVWVRWVTALSTTPLSRNTATQRTHAPQATQRNRTLSHIHSYTVCFITDLLTYLRPHLLTPRHTHRQTQHNTNQHNKTTNQLANQQHQQHQQNQRHQRRCRWGIAARPAHTVSGPQERVLRHTVEQIVVCAPVLQMASGEVGDVLGPCLSWASGSRSLLKLEYSHPLSSKLVG